MYQSKSSSKSSTCGLPVIRLVCSFTTSGPMYSPPSSSYDLNTWSRFFWKTFCRLTNLCIIPLGHGDVMFCLGVWIHLSNKDGSVRTTWYNAAKVNAKIVDEIDLNALVDLAALRPYGLTVFVLGLPWAYATRTLPTYTRAVHSISSSSASSHSSFLTRRNLSSLVFSSEWIQLRNSVETRLSNVLFTSLENRIRY